LKGDARYYLNIKKSKVFPNIKSLDLLDKLAESFFAILGQV